jgi:hypothetical protein
LLSGLLALDVRNPQDKESVQNVVTIPSLTVFGCGSMAIRPVLQTPLITTHLNITTVHLTMMQMPVPARTTARRAISARTMEDLTEADTLVAEDIIDLRI